MRKYEYIAFVIIGILSMLNFNSCSNDEEEKNESEAEFPVMTESTITPDVVTELEFDASGTWKLSSDKVWLKFIDDTGTYPSVSGKEGSQNVKIIATDGALGFSVDTAHVSMTMAGETQVIAVYYRQAKEREVKMYTMNSNEFVEIDSFTDSTFNRYESIAFEANFDWMLDDSSVPEWLLSQGTSVADLWGEAGTSVSDGIYAYVDADVAYRYQDLSGELKISSVDGEYSVSFPVRATAIPAKQIYWIGRSISLRYGYYWDDKGGQLYRQPVDGTYENVDGDVVCQVVVLDNDFTLHFVEYDSSNGTALEIPEDSSWMHVTNVDGGKITLKPDTNYVRDERSLYLFVVPKDTTVDYSTYFRWGRFNFSQEGYGIQLTQLGKSGGFSVLKQITSMSYEELSEPVQASNSAEIAEHLGLQKVDNIYEKTFTKEEWDLTNRIHIQPLGLLQNWSDYDLYNSSFESMEEPTGWATQAFEIGGIYDAQWQRHMTVLLANRVPYDEITDSCLYIVIRDSSGSDLGTFVIKK